jgi:hypothetical protein
MIPLILFLAGVALCISKHNVWGTLCITLAVLALLA